MESDPLQTKLELARQLVATRLNEMYGDWSVEHRWVQGPGSLAVLVEDLHHCGETHLDLGFVLNRDRLDVPVLWDCVAGMGSTAPEGLARAVETWSVSTLPVCLELLTGDGSFAEHFHGGDEGGCSGWHVIHGPLITYGNGDAPDVLQAWALDNPLLPALGKLASKSFGREALNSVKLLFGFGGDDIAEVRVHGECDDAASA